MGFLEKLRTSTELEQFRRQFDDLLNRFGFDWSPRFPFDREFFSGWEAATMRPAIESYIEGGKFIARADLPGVDPKNVDIKVVGDVLRITGSREGKREKVQLLRHEIRYGSFERSIEIPEGIKAEDLTASYHHGVLEISAPMPKEALPREVKIQIEGPKAATEKTAVA